MKAETVNFNELSEEYKKLVMNFILNIDFGDKSLPLHYATDIQRRINAYYETLLIKIDPQKIKLIGEELNRIYQILEKFNSVIENKGFLQRIGFYKPKKHVENIINNYTKLENEFNTITKEIEYKKIELLKDVSLLDEVYKYCEQYLKKLSLYIIAGDEKIKLYKDDREKTITEMEKLDKISIVDTDTVVKQFIHRVNELKKTRLVTSQIMSLIIMVQNNNVILVERINSSIVNTLPIWEKNMLKVLSEAIEDTKNDGFTIDTIKEISGDYTLNVEQVISIQEKSLNIIKEIETKIL